MTLTAVVDAFSGYLGPLVDATVGPAVPTSPADLPAITVSLDAIENGLASIGASPAPSRTGALPVHHDFDLADTTLTFADGETVDLLSADRRSLHFPNGPVVGAGGEETPNLGPLDLIVEVDGSSLTVVVGPPGGGEVRGIPALGEVVFGTALPATGELSIDFFVGEWEVRIDRYQGVLVVDTAAADAATTTDVSRTVVEALYDADIGSLPGLHSLRPLSLGSVDSLPDVASGRSRRHTYRFDYEVEVPNLGTGGGVIGTVDVDSFIDDALTGVSGPEEFEVTA